MAKEFSLLDEFELTGKWWLPENPTEQLYGCLKFKLNYIILEISGIFSKKHTFQLLDSEIMHGLTNENKKITLCRVSERIKSVSNDNFGKSDFSCKYIFIGRHFDHLEDIKFSYININFTYLDKWINNAFECKHIVDDKYNINMVEINYKLNLEHINSSLWISSIPTVLGDVRNEVNFCYTSNIGVKPNEAKTWKWFQELILNLKNLLTLFMGCPVYPISLSAKPIDCHDFEKIDIYYAIRNPLIFDDFPLKEIDVSFQDLVKFSNCSNHIVADVINNWLKKLEKIGPVFDLFFLTFYDSSMKPYMHFLTLMQAIEIFHRRVCGGRYIDSKVYDSTRKALVKAIPDEFDMDLKDNLVSKIGSGNEFALKMRLKKLLNYGPGAFKWFKMIIKFERENEDEFIGKLVNTRNHYTHWNENKKPIFNEEDLPRINYELSLLLRIFLIEEIDSKGILSEFKIFNSSMNKLRRKRELRQLEKSQRAPMEE